MQMQWDLNGEKEPADSGHDHIVDSSENAKLSSLPFCKLTIPIKSKLMTISLPTHKTVCIGYLYRNEVSM